MIILDLRDIDNSNKDCFKKENFLLYHDDCFKIMEDLINQGVKVDLVLTDPPYNTIKGIKLKGWDKKTTEWDDTLDTKTMFECVEKILRVNGTCILFSQEPYTSYLRQYNPYNLVFSYPLYWLKDHFANNLSCNKAPVNFIENLSVFYKQYDTEIQHPLRVYAKQLLEEIGLSYKTIENKLGHSKADHFLNRINSSQFGLCTEETYNELIREFHIDELSCFLSYEELQRLNNKYKRTFYKSFDNETNYKSNVFKYKRPYNNFHPTEKPVDLLEDLICTYSNAGDVVLDFTMGSGSTGVACMNTGRKFIGIELNQKYYNISKDRLIESNVQKRLI